jgi:hypothetical protein
VRLVQAAGIEIPVEAWGGALRVPQGWRDAEANTRERVGAARKADAEGADTDWEEEEDEKESKTTEKRAEIKEDRRAKRAAKKREVLSEDQITKQELVQAQTRKRYQKMVQRGRGGARVTKMNVLREAISTDTTGFHATRKGAYTKLAELPPSDDYCRFQNSWRRVTSRDFC